MCNQDKNICCTIVKIRYKQVWIICDVVWKGKVLVQQLSPLGDKPKKVPAVFCWYLHSQVPAFFVGGGSLDGVKAHSNWLPTATRAGVAGNDCILSGSRACQKQMFRNRSSLGFSSSKAHISASKQSPSHFMLNIFTSLYETSVIRRNKPGDHITGIAQRQFGHQHHGGWLWKIKYYAEMGFKLIMKEFSFMYCLKN